MVFLTSKIISMKFVIALFLFLVSALSVAQNNVLVMQKKDSEFFKEIKENKRIKIETKQGQKIYGRFTIIDSSSILINEEVILLNDIEKIKKKSLFAKITNPVFIATGLLFVTGGIVGISAGGYGYITGIALLPSGTVITLVSILSNNHPSHKWNYSIQFK